MELESSSARVPECPLLLKPHQPLQETVELEDRDTAAAVGKMVEVVPTQNWLYDLSAVSTEIAHERSYELIHPEPFVGHYSDQQ